MTFEESKEIIKQHGGIFLSSERRKIGKARRQYIKFQCENGHITEKRYEAFGKTWCFECTKLTIEDAHKLAEKRGGKFISEKYINNSTKYKWSCENEHIFEAQYNNVQQGRSWCKKCWCYSLEDMQNLALSKGGKCLTENFTNASLKLKWECRIGHTWQAIGSDIVRGQWCPECVTTICERTCRKILEFLYKKDFPKKRPPWLKLSTGGRLELDGYCKDLNIAFEYNGTQHYNFVRFWHKTQECFEMHQKRDEEKLRLCREKGVKLIVIPYTVKYYDLYRYIRDLCLDLSEDIPQSIDYEILDIRAPEQDKLQMIRKHVENKHEGELISKTYVNTKTKLQFRCKNGHLFFTTWGSISQGGFCKKCFYLSLKLATTKRILEFAAEHKLEMISEYQICKTLLELRCQVCDRMISKTWDNLRNNKRVCCR